jgi:hypothetical protein
MVFEGKPVKSKPDTKTVAALLKLRKSQMLLVNPEYQRGEVWTRPQQKRLVDSVLRGYPIPLIYLHYIRREIEGFVQEGFEVIDGQQRLNALYQYIEEGSFALFDPIADEEEARYPSFIKDTLCPWGGKKFENLEKDTQLQLLNTPLSIVMIETNEPNEARDLFIRLQGGMPLSPQEKRDAWPGNFTEFVLKVGGKPELPNYQGHDFFKTVMGAKVSKRGEMRQLTAQLMMLFMSKLETGRLCDIGRDEIDTFYYKHLTFDSHGTEAQRFVEILTILTKLLGDDSRKRVIVHEAIHLLLLVDGLLDEYTLSWRKTFPAAFDLFRAELAAAKLTKDDAAPSEFWLQYGLLTRFDANGAGSIQRRHEFFAQKMYGWLKLELKDPQRIFGPLDRELIFYRDKKQCQVCNTDVPWAEHEIHHVKGHAQGGKTVMENGVLVHKHCHPLGKLADDFAVRYWAKMEAASAQAQGRPAVVEGAEGNDE